MEMFFCAACFHTPPGYGASERSGGTTTGKVNCASCQSVNGEESNHIQVDLSVTVDDSQRTRAQVPFVS